MPFRTHRANLAVHAKWAIIFEECIARTSPKRAKKPRRGSVWFARGDDNDRLRPRKWILVRTTTRSFLFFHDSIGLAIKVGRAKFRGKPCSNDDKRAGEKTRAPQSRFPSPFVFEIFTQQSFLLGSEKKKKTKEREREKDSSSLSLSLFFWNGEGTEKKKKKREERKRRRRKRKRKSGVYIIFRDER